MNYLSEYKGPNEPNDVFAEFDKLSDDFKKTSVYHIEKHEEPEKLSPLQQRRQTRSERLAEKKASDFIHNITDKAESLVSSVKQKIKGAKGKKTKRRKYRVNILKMFLALFVLLIAGVIGCSIFVYSIIKDAVEINPSNINELLAESSILFDDEINVIDNIFGTHGEGMRTNINFTDMPPHLYQAFVAIEDRTFWDHSGLNMIRMVGAVRDALFDGGRVRGTSTITQQLARNIYLAETRLDRTIDRKIMEIYYAIIIERYLTKEQILEAYLNTIQLGFDTSGVQAAAQAYFSKDVGELNLMESVALAALPQAPTTYALVRRFTNDSVSEDNENILLRGNIFTYTYNGDASADRRNLIIRLMREQGYIDDMQAADLRADDLRNHMNPRHDVTAENSSYFVDYVRQQVIADLRREFNLDAEQANFRLNNHGLRIYTTLNSSAQSIIEAEFTDSANFPSVANLNRVRDSAGNIIDSNRNIFLYHYDNYFDENGTFTLAPDEYEKRSDGSLKIFGGNRLNFFRTEVRGEVDYSVEFKDMYLQEDGVFYSIKGGFISIAGQYKSRDNDGNLVISAKFFEDRPGFFTESNKGLSISSTSYALQQRIIQPQSAMVITEHDTGHIKAMVGGRNIVGRMLFNRADTPQPPGSAIKPIGVYGPALQFSVDALSAGSSVFPPDEDEPVTHMFGNFWTAASVIDDAPMMVGDQRWPRNVYNGFRGLGSMRYSIEHSVNVNAVKVFNEIGPAVSSHFLKMLGVTSIRESGTINDMNPAALALGGMTVGISPLEMASAYGTFANEGLYVAPIAYTRITNKNGDVLLENIPVTVQAMDPGVAFITLDMLRSNVTSGTNHHAAIGIQPVAGKTGTTNNQFDAWFVGNTPQFAASLWIGNDVNIQLSQGSVAASRLWSKIMRQVCEGLPTGQFPPAPPNVTSVTVDITSGMLPSDISAFGHRGSRSEFFINGTQPTAVDNIHTFVNVCTLSWHLSTPLCPYHTAAFGVRRPYVPDPEVLDINFEVPHFYCFVHNPDPELYPINTDAPWEYNWDGRGAAGNPEPNPGDPGETPPHIVDPSTDPDPGQNLDEPNIYDDIPEFLRDW